MVTININIGKKHLFVFCIVIGIVAGMLVAYAYNSPPVWPGDAANFGHSVDEVDWSRPIQASIEVRSTGPVLELVKAGGQPIDPMFILWGDINGGAKSDERMRVTREGNVGIGTTTPAARLDVNGDIKTTNGLKGVAWVGYKWVADGTQISCTTSNNVKWPGWVGGHYARINNGQIEIRLTLTNPSGSVAYDSGWKNTRFLYYAGGYPIFTNLFGFGADVEGYITAGTVPMDVAVDPVNRVYGGPLAICQANWP